MPSNAPVGSGTAAVTFRINWPPTSAAAPTGRRPKYLPATARSASIATNGGVPQYINSPTATLTFTAPVGLDTFVVQVYDEQNGKGDILSSADITQKISGSSANIVSTTLNGVIASLSLVLSTYTTAAGSVRNVAVAANGLDAEGNTIVGPGDYDRPIALAIVDPANTGTLSLSKKILATPGSVVTLAYNGGSLFSAQIVATANGVPSVSATFAPTPTFSRFAITQAGASPVYITQGSDGNMWFTDTGTNAIGKITPAGAIAEYTIPTPASGPRGITTVAADGSLWFTESTASQIGTLLTNGTNFREFPTATAGDRPQLLADRGDGNVWYAGEQGNDVSYQPTSGGASNVATSASQSGSEPFGVAAGTDANMYFTGTSPGISGARASPTRFRRWPSRAAARRCRLKSCVGPTATFGSPKPEFRRSASYRPFRSRS
jgi:streptogramin lyase